LNFGHCDLFGICDLSIAYVKLHQFFFRFDRPFFWSAAGLSLEPITLGYAFTFPFTFYL